MLRLPSFVSALIGSDTQSEALLAEQDVSAVTGVNGDDGVILRELADISLLFVDVTLAVEASYPVVTVAESLKHLLADSGHYSHVEHNIDAVGKLDAYLGELGANGAHGVRNNIHGSALVAVPCDIIEHLICL